MRCLLFLPFVLMMLSLRVAGADAPPRPPSLDLIRKVKAKRVIVLGVFHGWRKFDARNVLVFDPCRAWRSPDGEVPGRDPPNGLTS